MRRKLILKGWVKDARRVEESELAKELCLRTMARLRGFQSRE